MPEMIHPRYLPYTTEELAEHIPPIPGGRHDREGRWVRHFVESAETDREFWETRPDPVGLPVTEMRRPRQVDKDERFWIATTMMRLVRNDDAVTRLASVLADAFEQTPTVGSVDWLALLDGSIHLYFEANLPSPTSYKHWLAERVDRHPVAYVRDAARSQTGQIRTGLEGPTNVDALVVVPETGFGLLIEAKVLSDVSHDVTFDPIRNQIARNVDVMLEPNSDLAYPLATRRPDRSFFLLVTPQLFVDHPTSRLYGWLMNEYRSTPAALARDLPHRPTEQAARAAGRIGWTSWEAIAARYSDACPWFLP